MKCTTPITYYGGKQKKLNVLIPLVPPHQIYTEAYAGGAALFFAQPKASCDVINDINDMLINFYRVARSDYPGLKAEINNSLHSRSQFNKARAIYCRPELYTAIEKAWSVWYLCKISFGANMRNFGFNYRGNIPTVLANAKDRFTELIARKLEEVTLESKDGVSVIQKYDKPDTFHYIDPPYINTDCSSYSAPFDETKLTELLDLLVSIKGKFLMTMYSNHILTKYIT